MEPAQRPGDRAGTRIDRAEIRAAIAQQLGVPVESIADGADLIQLGLDSIRTMKLAGGWRKRGLEINFAQLAAAPSVAEWARLLGVDEAAAATPEVEAAAENLAPEDE